MSAVEPIVGCLYRDEDFPQTTPTRSARRLRLEELVAQATDAVFDQRIEQAVAALSEVLDLHKPWVFAAQVFAPRYVGVRYLGVGCRACGEDSANDLTGSGHDCWTIRRIAEVFGIQSDLSGELQ